MGEDISDKRLIFKVHKEFIQLIPKKKKKPNMIKKLTEDVNKTFFQRRLRDGQ